MRAATEAKGRLGVKAGKGFGQMAPHYKIHEISRIHRSEKFCSFCTFCSSLKTGMNDRRFTSVIDHKRIFLYSLGLFLK